MKYTPKELRARVGESQRETAKAMGIAYQTYCAWEKNLAKVPIGRVAELCRHFKIAISEIKYD